MRGRAGGGDPDFGSDSFLDIVANLVGILIVLVVLAGLRAAQVPVEPSTASDAESPRPLPVVALPAPEASIPTAPAETVDEPDASTPVIVADPEPETENGITLQAARDQIADAQQRIQSLQSQLNGLNDESTQAEIDSLQQQLAARALRLRELQAKLDRSSTQAGLLTAELQNMDSEYQQLRMRLVETNRRLEEIQRRKRPDKQLELRINPIGRRSSGEELLFRVENGQVVHLPVKELIETAIRLERNSMASILGGRSQRGVAGPVDGVTFNYEYGVASVPTYSGSGQAYTTQVRMRGLVKTLAQAPAEPIATALANGGLVERQLLQAEPGTVIRLAVSTDSFADARRIAAYARDLNFAVASRPIEPGSDLPVHLSDRSDAIAQ